MCYKPKNREKGLFGAGSYFKSTSIDNPFYFDLVCIRLTKFSKYNASYVPVFSDALSKTDNDFVEEISSRIEFYIDYGDFILNLPEMSDSKLYVEVAKKITQKSIGEPRANILLILQSFDKIFIHIDSKILLTKLDSWNPDVISKENVKILSPSFYKEAIEINNNLTKHCIKCMKDNLLGLSVEEWYRAIIDYSYNYQVAEILDAKITQNEFDALKKILKDIATRTLECIPDKERITSLLEKAHKEGRGLTNAFKEVRDTICFQSEMSTDLFVFFGNWLFKYAKLNDKKESLRRIFISEILDVQDNLNLMLENRDTMVKIVTAAEEESEDFKIKIRTLVEKDPSNVKLLEFAKEIGVVFKPENDESQER
jgi:hypothetical protein